MVTILIINEFLQWIAIVYSIWAIYQIGMAVKSVLELLTRNQK